MEGELLSIQCVRTTLLFCPIRRLEADFKQVSGDKENALPQGN